MRDNIDLVIFGSQGDLAKENYFLLYTGWIKRIFCQTMRVLPPWRGIK